MSANDIQPGGNHYKRAGKIQHWDLCGEYKIGYFEAAATKYVSRWRQKNGLEDLQKADHYLQKRLELAEQFPQTHKFPESHVPPDKINQWCMALGLTEAEIEFMHLVLNWWILKDLQDARKILAQLLAEKP